ncbi:GbsR/MarR family transcriptional regulator [Sphingomonas sp. NFX23]|uniref:GbsR/MarR family transcriptional regulator n=1 Tax=Sphingomonas sp. NFX23 TaxID=2819532 RepID=UPI003CEF6EB3
MNGIEEFVERFGIIGEEDGMSRTAGRMLALLLSAGAPLSFSEIAKRLQVSRGGVSTNVRLLEEMGMVERVSRPGDRQDYFQFPADGWHRQIERQMARERKARQCAETLLGSGADLSPVARQRVSYMADLLKASEAKNRETLKLMSSSDA